MLIADLERLFGSLHTMMNIFWAVNCKLLEFELIQNA